MKTFVSRHETCKRASKRTIKNFQNSCYSFLFSHSNLYTFEYSPLQELYFCTALFFFNQFFLLNHCPQCKKCNTLCFILIKQKSFTILLKIFCIFATFAKVRVTTSKVELISIIKKFVSKLPQNLP